MIKHPLATRTTWLAQRKLLLEKEKAFMALKDELAEARRALPWVLIEKDYRFESGAGQRSLADLFGPHSQLIVYHFMFGPNAEVGCKSCSFWADHWRAAVPHLAERDVTMLAVSRAPLAKLEAFKQRQGWTFEWVSSGEGDFNYDFQVSFREAEHAAGKSTYNYAPLSATSQKDLPGFSVFKKDANGAVFHTYSTFGRGIELMNATYQLLDLVPAGRNEAGLPSPMAWVKYGYDHQKSA
jgi:predicted dithiol-disulfide oxidoreductase (DUF899 family)